MALIKPTIKWPKENYSLGSYYAKLTPSMRQQVDAALNNIDPETYPGRVLEGHLVFNEGHKRTFFLNDPNSHVGTDASSLLHINFTLKAGPGSTESWTGNWHLYPDGRCTYGYTDKATGQFVMIADYAGVGGGGNAVAPVVVAPAGYVHKEEEFPGLGGGAGGGKSGSSGKVKL